ncbi:MAG: aconitate hydratase AcnA [Hydrotalea sp.]|nr:aconitate hydratase AcnA [Hydrotalea sp.]
MTNQPKNPFANFVTTLQVATDQPGAYHYYPIAKIAKDVFNTEITQLPRSLKILFENAVRAGDETSAREIIAWLKNQKNDREIGFRPARVLLQDFTGVPAIADLAAMRDAMRDLGRDPSLINPDIPVDLVIDHSVMVNEFGRADSLSDNMAIEFHENLERYQFLKWGQGSFNNLRIVPPGLGICHQVNIEYLAQVIFAKSESGATGDVMLYPDTLVGTDSHTTMVNGLGVLGFGVGGIEAEAAMLGQPIPLVIPEVIGFKLSGKLPVGATATDLVLMVTQMLRKKNVVNKFVEFYGDGLALLSAETRATLANMAPEYGATVGLFPIDKETIRYLTTTARAPELLARVEGYAKANGLWHDETMADPVFTDSLALDLADVEPALAGPKRPQDRVPLRQVKAASLQLDEENKKLADALADPVATGKTGQDKIEGDLGDKKNTLPDHAVVIAAITSCTNTSNPFVMLAAGLVARRAVALGLKPKPWVKTSLAPGSRVVRDYLQNAGLSVALDQLGFNIVGFGCTTCIGNSGPLKDKDIEEEIKRRDLTVAAVLSGNRNFEGRIHPLVKANWLGSPPLVVAYALLGSTARDITTEPLGQDKNGKDVFLKDIWPTEAEIQKTVDEFVTPAIYQARYANIFAGTDEWQKIKNTSSPDFDWGVNSTYIKQPPFFTLAANASGDIRGAKILAWLGSSITTDHISPAGSIKPESPAGEYLLNHQVTVQHFNSFGSRRGNHEVMVRGTLANIRLKNKLASKTGGFTKYNGKETTIFEAAMDYQKHQQPLIIIAGREYGTGSSRDWAAKGVRLLGVQAVVAVSFERIHRSNLIGMGVVPLEFVNEDDYNNLQLNGSENFEIVGLADLTPQKIVSLVISGHEKKIEIKVKARIDNDTELQYFKKGGVLPFMLQQMAGQVAA